ncbi:MAG TPA: bifunctional demethylmenaquinone methyltransferase/2-methoxy-6-polyprenyl-1,4-benzoquinol methylase UbiE [Syntrophorhabdales bacterium]|nr:bifunctional demethylmenaquinone methyltransferase/2-methoxy-6-polyprenyl-1,4-benzoquinol methylase UbiE [Syntrophorhabdales bacterium]
MSMPPNNQNTKTDRAANEPSVSFGFRKVSETEKRKLVDDHFDSIASKYDWMNTVLSFGLHYLWKRVAVRMSGIKAGDKVLDVCGGTADLALLAADLVGGKGIVIVYDINESMMRRGQAKAAASRFSERILFVQGDAERISLPDDSLDAVMVGFGIRNFVHLQEGLREMHRVLKKGGSFTCLEFSRPDPAWFRALYNFYSFVIMPLAGKILAGTREAYTYLPESIRLFPLPDELADSLRDIGFSNVTYKRLTNGIAVVHRAEKT